VAGHAAVGVHDDLAAGEAGVADRAADHELAGGVHEEVVAARVEELLLVVELRRQHRVHDVLPQVRLDQRLGVHAVLVLRRDQHALDLDRAAVLVANRDLRLAVRPQVGHQLGAADLGEAMSELVRERDRHRHELLRLTRRVAEHHALVAGACHVELVVVRRVGAGLVGLVHALRDVGRLLVDRGDDGARIAVEPVPALGVADLADRLARDLRDVHVHVGRDLARDDDEAGVHERLAGDAALGILGHHGVEDSIRDLVGHLVRMAFRDRLGGEQELVV
jgi:hypothetical protein